MVFTSIDSEAQRRRAVALAVALTTGTLLAPQRYERHLLARYERGECTIDEVEALLDASTYQVLYHSRATHPLAEAQLWQLLNWSRRHNAEHHITGLLLYSHEQFVQVLEGPREAVCALYARIEQDDRHKHLVTLCAEPGPGRRFADWSMDFGYITPEVEQALAAVANQRPLPEPGLNDVRLQALLETLGDKDYKVS